MDWSLLGCGAKGHFTYAPEEPALRERLGLATPGGTAWRCLRCGTFVPGPPVASGPVADAPRVRRGKELRSALILRLFAIERFVRAIVFGVLAYLLWRFSVSRLSVEKAFDRELPLFRSAFHLFGYNIDHSKLLGFIEHAFTLDSRTLTWLAIGATAYTLVEIIEGLGLWLARRWGEYFAMVATSAGLPLEIYELSHKITVLRVLAFVINLALVFYLVLTKRLFGARGGKKAYEARLRSESVLDLEQAALSAEQAAATPPASPEPPHSDAARPAGAGPHRTQAEGPTRQSRTR